MFAAVRKPASSTSSQPTATFTAKGKRIASPDANTSSFSLQSTVPSSQLFNLQENHRQQVLAEKRASDLAEKTRKNAANEAAKTARCLKASQTERTRIMDNAIKECVCDIERGEIHTASRIAIKCGNPEWRNSIREKARKVVAYKATYPKWGEDDILTIMHMKKGAPDRGGRATATALIDVFARKDLLGTSVQLKPGVIASSVVLPRHLHDSHFGGVQYLRQQYTARERARARLHF